jgi:hypothetical protein
LRIIARRIRAAAVLVFAFLAVVSVSAAQQTEVMMPAESAAKAKEILQQAIEGLGGAAYLNVHDVTCTGRLGQFGHSGELNGYGHFEDFTIPSPPFKDRQENIPKRNIIEVRNGDKGWDLDRGGVSEARTSELAQYQEDMKKDIDNILRHRIHEADMVSAMAGRMWWIYARQTGSNWWTATIAPSHSHCAIFASAYSQGCGYARCQYAHACRGN